MTNLRKAAQQALRLIEDEGHKADLLEAASILRAALAEQKCPCGDRPADQCPGEWEPGCDLEANEKYAKVAEQAQPVPPGWRMVPVEPTDAMVLAGIHAIYAASGEFEPVPSEIDALFEAMLAAAPEAPSPLVPQPLTIERLRGALVASRIIDPGAVEDADHYDDGVMLQRIEALFRRIA